MVSFISVSNAIDKFREVLKPAQGSRVDQLINTMQYQNDHLLELEAFETACDLIHEMDWDFDNPDPLFDLFIPIYTDLSELKDEEAA